MSGMVSRLSIKRMPMMAPREPDDQQKDVVEAEARSRPPGASTQGGEGPWLLSAALETVPAWADPVVSPDTPAGVQKPVGQAISAIGFVRARILKVDGRERLEVVECRAGGNASANERALVSGFWTSFDSWKPRLLSFNGRGHLIPVLRFASMRNGITARHMHEAGDKWSGYGHRFSTAFHTDLMEVLADYHASTYPSLAETARALGLPLVPPLVGAGAGIRERAVCNASVVFLAYLRWQLYTGVMDREGHDLAVSSLARVASSASQDQAASLVAEALATAPGKT